MRTISQGYYCSAFSNLGYLNYKWNEVLNTYTIIYGFDYLLNKKQIE